jgi:RNA polymerase sigma-70 factor (ECF subfamily)
MMVTTTTDLPEIWKEFHRRLRGFIAQQVNNPADVDDILQDVFLRIHQRLGTLRDSDRLGSWIFQIARHTIIDYYRKAYRQHELPSENIPEVSTTDEDTRFFHQQMAGCLRPLLSQLPETYREAVARVELEGLTQKQVAEALGISISGMKSRVQRGRQKLKTLLETCCEIQLDTVGNAIDYEIKDLTLCRTCGLVK